MGQNTLVTPADYAYDGFLSDKFPLKTAERTMNHLHQRTITGGYVTENDIRSRVYYNLVVLFRLLWHHRTLEGTSTFWESIYRDFGAKSGKPPEFEALTAHYVGAREAFHRRYGSKSRGRDSEESTLSQLVDQWRFRPPIDKNVARLVRQFPDVCSRRAGSSWDVVLDDSRHRERLVLSKDLNWPTLAQHSLNKARLAPGLSARAPGSSSSSTLNGSKLTSKPGRLTPPVGRSPASLKTTLLRLVEPNPEGKKSGSGGPIGEGESSMPATPRKRSASGFDEPSPFSKRRLITQTAHGQSGGKAERRPGKGGTSRQAQGDGGSDETSVQPQQSDEAGVPSSNEPSPSVEPQSLEEMIASAGGSPSAIDRPGTMPEPSSGLNEGFALPAKDAFVLEAQDGHATPPVVDFHGNSMVLVNVPATLFMFARRIENLERIAGGKERAEEALATFTRYMARLEKTVEEQAHIPVVVSSLSSKVTEFEKTFEDRDELSATVSTTTSILTSTINGLEKKLGEAAEIRGTIAALSRRVTELEKMVREKDVALASEIKDLEKTTEERVAVQASKTKDLETAVETLSKILEVRGLKKAGELVE